MFYSSTELTTRLAQRARDCRLAADLTQAGLAHRAGVTLASLRRFEATGQVSLDSFAKLVLALGRGAELAALLPPPPIASLDALAASPAPRKRGRRT